MTVKIWLHGLMAAAIGAFSSSITLIIVDPAKFNFSTDGFLSLGKVSLVAAILAVAGYLAKSPLPTNAANSSRDSLRKLGAVALCAVLLMGATTGCTSAQVANVVKNIAIYAQEAQPIVTEVLALVMSFSDKQSNNVPTASEIQMVSNKIKTDLSDLATLCNAYTAHPSSSVWQQIVALVDDLVTNGDSALTEIAGIKSSASQQGALATLASLDALLHTIDGFMQTTQSSTQVKATAARRAIKIQAVSRYWSDRDKVRMSQDFGQDYFTLYRHEIAMGF
jgi:uncharacterized membrane protein